MNLETEFDIATILTMLYAIEAPDDQELDLLRRNMVIEINDRYEAHKEQEIESEDDDSPVQVEEVFKLLDQETP